MVVTMMLGDVSQSDSKNPVPEISLYLQVLDGAEAGQLPAAVKNLTTTGVILDVECLNSDAKTAICKDREGFLKVTSEDGSGLIELPGKILWAREHKDETAVTLGLELLEPLPLPVRHLLEADLDIGAKDMKVLWDIWDEINENTDGVDVSEPEKLVLAMADAGKSADQTDNSDAKSENTLYWAGFGTILAGLAMQLPQSEYLGFAGLVIMFGGSMLVAWKSLISMRQIAPARPAGKSS
jgi:hypothetical protein